GRGAAKQKTAGRHLHDHAVIYGYAVGRMVNERIPVRRILKIIGQKIAPPFSQLFKRGRKVRELIEPLARGSAGKPGLKRFASLLIKHPNLNILTRDRAE